jgi:hypothetical protein
MLVATAAVVLITSHTARDLYVLPFIIPGAVLAAGGLSRLPAWLVRGGFWFSVLLLGSLIGLCWLLWLYSVAVGHVPHWPWLGAHLPLAFTLQWHPIGFIWALLITTAWIAGCVMLRPPRPAALSNWPVGLTVLWSLVITFYLPWLDAAKSYRSVFNELAAQLPESYTCVANLTQPKTIRLRESERGLLHYIAGIRIHPITTLADNPCDVLLLEVQRRHHQDGFTLEPDWHLQWSGQRAGDQRDQFLLFVRHRL